MEGTDDSSGSSSKEEFAQKEEDPASNEALLPATKEELSSEGQAASAEDISAAEGVEPATAITDSAEILESIDDFNDAKLTEGSGMEKSLENASTPEASTVSHSTVAEGEKDASSPAFEVNVEAEPAEELPQASSEALEFLDSITDEDFMYNTFDDKLVTASSSGDLGEFNISVQALTYNEIDCFLVHANSHGYIEGVLCGTSIVAYVTRQLETLEQRHHEYVKVQVNPLDRKTMVLREGNQIVINKTMTQGEEVQQKNYRLDVDNVPGLILEGANILLQRIMIKKEAIPSSFQLLALDSDANVCPVTYKSLGKRLQRVNEVDLHVIGMQRTIRSKSDIPIGWHAYFMKDGHLINRVQIGSPVTMRVLTIPELIISEDYLPKPEFKKQPLNFEEDEQLHSNYLDRKEQLLNDYSVYMRHKPEIKTLLADFLQFLLLRKPDDILSFAADYFASFSTKVPKAPPYLSSKTMTPSMLNYRLK